MIQLNHIGIAVAPQLLQSIKDFYLVLGLDVAHSEVVPDQGLKVHFLNVGGPGVHLELLEPQDNESTVAKFIEKKGSGVHHISFQVADGTLDDVCNRLRSKNYKLIYPQARLGAHQMRVNFVHPQSTGGVLIELQESAGGAS